jgi:hypothetical protein
MRILFSSTRGAGHLQPLLPYAKALVARGHEVRIAAPAEVGPTLGDAGLEIAPFGHPGDKALAPIWARLASAPAAESVQIAVSELFAGACATAALPALLETIRSWKPELVVRESAELASIVAAQITGVAHARVAVHMPSFEERSFLHDLTPFDALRVHAGLAADGGAMLRAEPVFTAFPRHLDDPAVQLAGRDPFRVRTAEAAIGGSDRWARPGAPLVYITFGTIAGGRAETQAPYRVALEAVATLPVRGLLTTGPQMPRDALGKVPSNVEVEAWIPQREVLPHVALIVHHGGSGTLLGGAAAGTPMVISPMGADQPHNGAQIERIGAGLVSSSDVDEMRAAIVRVLEEGSFKLGARRLADDMAKLSPLDSALDAMLAVAG